MRTPNEKNGNGEPTVTAPSFQFQCKGFGLWTELKAGDYAASAQAISDIFVGSTVAKAYKRYDEFMGSSNKSLTSDLLGTIFGAGVDFGKSGPCSGGN
jgi:hypothetical protein